MLQSVGPETGAPPKPEEKPQDASRTWLGNTPSIAVKAVLQGAIAAAILVVAFAGMNMLVASRPDVPRGAIEERRYAVDTVTAVQGDYAPAISVFGETMAAREVELRALVGGEVLTIHPDLKPGGSVSRGDVLLEIDRFDYEGAVTEAEASLAEERALLVENQGRLVLEKANLARAREQLEFAERDLARAQELLGRGSTTEQVVDERKLVVSQRQQGLEQTQNILTLEEARVTQQNAAIERAEWRLANAQRQLRNTVLTAPFDAIVRSEAAELGRLVSVNDAVVSLYSSDEFEVRFTLSDNQYGRLLADDGTVEGREVEVIWYLGNQPVIYPAVVSRIGADVASSRGGVDLIATIDTENALVPLRPGAFVEIVVPDQTYENSFRVPETGYYGQGTIYVIEDNRLQQRQVDALAIDDGYVIVRGDLNEGETVLVTRIPEAGEGLLVIDVGAPAAVAAEDLATAQDAQSTPAAE